MKQQQEEEVKKMEKQEKPTKEKAKTRKKGLTKQEQKKPLKPQNLVAQIARCNRDVRCDSNRTPPNH